VNTPNVFAHQLRRASIAFAPEDTWRGALSAGSAGQAPRHQLSVGTAL